MWWVAAGTQNLLQCTPNINKQCLLSNRLQPFFELSHITTGTWLWKFILLFKMAEDAYLRTKQWAEWRLSMTVRRLHLKHWAEQIHANKHTLKLYGSTSLTLFLSYTVVYYRPRSRRRRPFFASRHLPETVLSMKNMAFYINVNTDQRPKIHNSLTETVYIYIQYIKHIWETE